MFQIHVEEVKRGTQKHTLASCRVRLATEDGDEFIAILDARVLHNRSGELWVAYPTQNLRDFEGLKFHPILEFSRNLRHRIEDAVLKEYKREDAYIDVRSEETGCPAVRPAVHHVRQALIGSGARVGVNNVR